MRRTHIMVAAVMACTNACWAQLQTGPGAPPAPSQKLAKVGADGKIEQLDGLVELDAIKKSTELDNAAREKIKKLAREWLLDVQQQVIDNVDFMQEIEPADGKPGFFETFDVADPKSMERIAAFAKQLQSPGQLLNTLEFRRAIDPNVSMRIRQTVYEYDAAVQREVMSDPKASLRHQYRTGYRDVIGMYHRLLDRTVPKLDEAMAALKLPAEQGAALAPAVGAVKTAEGKPASRMAVRGLLSQLTLQQRRALLLKVRDLSPIEDPFTFE